MAQIIALCLALWAFALNAGAHILSPEAQCVAVCYTGEIGVLEATGANDGAAVEKYLATTHLTKGYAWCAAFVNWALESCGVETVKSAWSPAWFPKDRVVYTHGSRGPPPQTADVFGIYFPNKKRIAHVGFIDKWPAGEYCITVEGNTNTEGSRDGDGVYKKRRLKRQIYKVARWVD